MNVWIHINKAPSASFHSLLQKKSKAKDKTCKFRTVDAGPVSPVSTTYMAPLFGVRPRKVPMPQWHVQTYEMATNSAKKSSPSFPATFRSSKRTIIVSQGPLRLGACIAYEISERSQSRNQRTLKRLSSVLREASYWRQNGFRSNLMAFKIKFQ